MGHSTMVYPGSLSIFMDIAASKFPAIESLSKGFLCIALRLKKKGTPQPLKAEANPCFLSAKKNPNRDPLATAFWPSFRNESLWNITPVDPTLGGHHCSQSRFKIKVFLVVMIIDHVVVIVTRCIGHCIDPVAFVHQHIHIV